MGKRKLNGSHPLIVFPKTHVPFGIICKSYVDLLCVRAEIDYIKIMSGLEVVTSETFADVRALCERFADNNHALTHAYLSYYFLSLFERAQGDQGHGHINTTNHYLFGSMAQHELTWLCVHLPPEDLKTIYSWYQVFDLPRELWQTSIAGALTVARLARALVCEGAEVRLPTAHEDCVAKIDLIASFPFRSDGLCIQVETKKKVFRFKHRVLSLRNADWPSEDDLRRFCKGTRQFQKTYRGIWIPVEMIFGKESKQLETIEMPKEVLDEIHRCLKGVLDEHDAPAPSAAL